MTSASSLTEQLAVSLTRAPEESDRIRARWALLDWLACVAGARRSPLAGRLAGAHIPASERAAWLGNLLEMDDIHRGSILHPGPAIWPTLLATPGEDAMDGLLDAALAGYEATIAIGATFDARHYAHFHPTTTAGLIGAAAAAAVRLGCTPPAVAAAMGLAGSVTGGLWQMRHEASDAKQWHIAHVARTGREAALAAADGIAGPRFILEGPQGWYAATCDAPRPMELPPRFAIHDVSFKPWGACRHAHPAIDAALGLGLVLADEPVMIETYADALTFCDRPDPASVIEAKFSIQHSVAIVLAGGTPRLEDFEPEGIARLASHRARVTVRESPAFTGRYPDHYGASARAGDRFCERIDTLGDPERPLGEEHLVAKLAQLTQWGGLPPHEAERARRVALNGSSVGAVTGLLEDWLA